MATIKANTNEKVFGISQWGGLNEHPDGDTRLKMGEASTMINWRITKDGNLKRRPGSLLVDWINDTSIEYENTYSKRVLIAGDDMETAQLHSAGSISIKGGEITLGTASDYYVKNMQGIVRYWYDDDNVPCKILRSTGWNSTLGTHYILSYYPAYINVPSYTRPITGMWSGYVGGQQHFLAVCWGNLYSLYNPTTGQFAARKIGKLFGESATDSELSNPTSFIPWDNKLYILNGIEYHVWNGTFPLPGNEGNELPKVEGYRPLVAVAIGPLVNGEPGTSSSGETTTEYVNRLNGKRRVWISPDDTGKSFQLPEKGVTDPSPTMAIDWIKDLSTTPATTVDSSNYSFTVTTGIVTFAGNYDLKKGVNNYEIAYSVTENYRTQVTHNLFYELYSGNTDTRIILYGDGTNRALYSGMDYNGQPRADYFPDQYELRVGDENTPITGMIRHYGDLVAYKTNEAWAVSYGVIDLATDALTPAYYCIPVNKTVGHTAMGQIRLVNNNPVTCFGNNLYHWINSSYYTSALSRDERQANRISDRVQKTIGEMYLPGCVLYDDNDHQEFYVVEAGDSSGKIVVWNYANDTWYTYSNLDITCMCNFQGELYYGSSDGRIYHLTDTAQDDDGNPIEAIWISGAMDFGADYMRKYSSMMWVGLTPVDGTSVVVDIMTDQKNNFREKIVSSSKAKVEGQPFTVKTKIKAKKFVNYRLGFFTDWKQPPVTVTDVSFRVRTTGYAK